MRTVQLDGPSPTLVQQHNSPSGTRCERSSCMDRFLRRSSSTTAHRERDAIVPVGWTVPYLGPTADQSNRDRDSNGAVDGPFLTPAVARVFPCHSREKRPCS